MCYSIILIGCLYVYSTRLLNQVKYIITKHFSVELAESKNKLFRLLLRFCAFLDVPIPLEIPKRRLNFYITSVHDYIYETSKYYNTFTVQNKKWEYVPPGALIID